MATSTAWARVNHAAALGDGRVALIGRREGRAELLLASGPGSVAEHVPCVPALPEAAATACRLRASPATSGRLLVSSPSSLGVLTMPPTHDLQSTLAVPPARYTALGLPLLTAAGSSGSRLVDACWHPLSTHHVLALFPDALRLFDVGDAASASTSVHDPVETWLLPPTAAAASPLGAFASRQLPAPPVALSFGSARGWELFAAFLICEDGSLFCVCPCVPPGFLLSTADWAELAAEADTAIVDAASALTRASSLGHGASSLQLLQQHARNYGAAATSHGEPSLAFSRLGGGGQRSVVPSTPAPASSAELATTAAFGGGRALSPYATAAAYSAPQAAGAEPAPPGAGQLDATRVRLQWLQACFPPLACDPAWRRYEPSGAFAAPPRHPSMTAAQSTGGRVELWAPALQGPIATSPSLALSTAHAGEGATTRFTPPPAVDLLLLPASVLALPCAVVLVSDGRLVSLVAPGPILPCWGVPSRTYAGTELQLAALGSQLAGLTAAAGAAAAPWLVCEALQLPLVEEGPAVGGAPAGPPGGVLAHPLAAARRALTHDGAAAFAGGLPGEGLAMSALMSSAPASSDSASPSPRQRQPLLPPACDVVSVPSLLPLSPAFPHWITVVSRTGAFAVRLGWLAADSRVLRALQHESASPPLLLHSEAPSDASGSSVAFRVWSPLGASSGGASSSGGAAGPASGGSGGEGARHELLGLALCEAEPAEPGHRLGGVSGAAPHEEAFGPGSLVAWSVGLGLESALLPAPTQPYLRGGSSYAVGATRGSFASPGRALAAPSSSGAAVSAAALLAGCGSVSLPGTVTQVALPLLAPQPTAGGRKHYLASAAQLSGAQATAELLLVRAPGASRAGSSSGGGAGSDGGLSDGTPFAAVVDEFRPLLALASAEDTLASRAQAAVDGANLPADGAGGGAGPSAQLALGALAAGAASAQAIAASLASLRTQTAARAASLVEAAAQASGQASRLARDLARLQASAATCSDRLALLAAGCDNMRARCGALSVAAMLQRGGALRGGDGAHAPVSAAEAAFVTEITSLRVELAARMPSVLARLTDAVGRLEGGGGASSQPPAPPVLGRDRVGLARLLHAPGGQADASAAQLASLLASLDAAGGAVGQRTGLVGALAAALAEVEVAAGARLRGL